MSLEFIINKIIKLDPCLAKYLQPLAAKTVAISCSDFPEKILYCTFFENHIQLSMQKPNTLVDAEIKGPLYGLLQLAIKKEQSDIRQSKVHFSGDIGVAQNLQQFMFKLDLDWEEELSKYTGDIIAHTAIQICRQIKSYSLHAKSSLEAMIGEYLQEESRMLPTAYEVNKYISAVDDLRLAVDRLEANIKLKVSEHASD